MRPHSKGGLSRHNGLLSSHSQPQVSTYCHMLCWMESGSHCNVRPHCYQPQTDLKINRMEEIGLAKIWTCVIFCEVFSVLVLCCKIYQPNKTHRVRKHNYLAWHVQQQRSKISRGLVQFSLQILALHTFTSLQGKCCTYYSTTFIQHSQLLITLQNKVFIISDDVIHSWNVR